MRKSPAELFRQREWRINEAIGLRTPDRVPMMCHTGFFPAYYAGMTCKEVMYDADKAIFAWRRFVEDFEPDAIDNPFTSRFFGSTMETLNYRQLAWAGRDLHENTSFQFVEDEYMKAEDYDQYLYDPSDFIIRTYWPRIFGALKPFEKLPPLHDIMCYYFGTGNLAAFGSPDIIRALEALTRAAKHAQAMLDGAARWAAVSRELGFPSQTGGLTQAPFDTISDFLRGTKGAMLDMFRRPGKVLAMIEKVYPLMLKFGLAAKARGNPRVFIPLHKGSDGFMSMDQFKTFYWPSLKKLIEALIAEACIPVVFWEGDVASRLEIIGDIPAGKAIYCFEQTDMGRAKEVIGQQVCLRGNVPLSLLIAGTPEDVSQYCRKLISNVGKGGGFILDSATVVDDARPENLKAMFDTVKNYGAY